jgi:hypothetical protein
MHEYVCTHGDDKIAHAHTNIHRWEGFDRMLSKE